MGNKLLSLMTSISKKDHQWSFVKVPCIFFHFESQGCALYKNGVNNTILEAIKKTIGSVIEELNIKRSIKAELTSEVMNKLITEIKEKVSKGLEDIVKTSMCGGLFLRKGEYYCPAHQLEFNSNYESIIPWLGDPEESGCLCYIAMTVQLVQNKNNVKKGK
ncbi:MAG: hypothetical protein ACFFCQ_08095 [Promethearchaeota archaeon]